MATQQVLLLNDVINLGRKGEVATAKSGFVRNYLLPQGIAVIADKGTLRMQARLQEERSKQAAEDKKASEEVAARLTGVIFSTEVKVDPEGHMYGSVAAQDIVKLINESTGIELEKKALILTHPIKQTGVHTVTVKLKEEVTCDIQVKVIAEGAAPEGEEEAAEGEQGAAQGGGVVTR